MLVAIHQPTFLPWLGWWDKFVRSDVFVLLDDVQFPKKGGTWMNRVRILVNAEPMWVTVPVDRTHHGVRSVRETATDETKPWREKITRTITTSYARAAHFDDVYPTLEDLLGLPTARIAELNEIIIRKLADRIGFDTAKIVRQSDLGVVHGTGTGLLMDICRAVEATGYLTGDGAGGYLEPESFSVAGIELIEQRYESPRYPQLSLEHVPGLSIVDALLNCGWDATAALVTTTR